MKNRPGYSADELVALKIRDLRKIASTFGVKYYKNHNIKKLIHQILFQQHELSNSMVDLQQHELEDSDTSM